MQMILDGTTGARWTASSTPTSRPSWATNVSPCRTTSTTLPSNRIRRVSRMVMTVPSVAGSGVFCSAGSGELGAGVLTDEFGVFGCPSRLGEALLGPVEPEVHLAGADRILVLAILAGRRPAVALTERADHHQVVAEPGFGPEPVELRHRLQHPGMVALAEPLQPLEVGCRGLGGEDVLHARRLVIAQLAQRPERVRERAGGDEHHLAVGLGDRGAGGPAQAQVVFGVRGLADTDRDPPLVRQALSEEFPYVGGGVEDRQVVVFDRGDPGAVLLRLGGDQVRQLRVAEEV